MNFVEVTNVSEEVQNKVKQNLKFKTGKFVWRVKFTAPLDATSINDKNLYVTDPEGKLLKTSIRYNSDTHEIEIEPLDAYARDSVYTLNVSKNVRSMGGQTLKKDVQLQFKV